MPSFGDLGVCPLRREERVFRRARVRRAVLGYPVTERGPYQLLRANAALCPAGRPAVRLVRSRVGCRLHRSWRGRSNSSAFTA